MSTSSVVWKSSRGLAIVAVVLAMSCASSPAAAATAQPPGWDAALRLAEPADLNPDPRVLEIELDARVARVEIAPGEIVEAWTYDGRLPGPLIRLRVGDRLIVHFRNGLPAPTTVHWHGIRVPFAMDGVPGYSQPDVEPGGTFTYDFVVPDAGLYWYHPHVMSHAQVGFGLYGALLVEDPRDVERVGVADELVLVLSDIAVEPDGTLQAPDAGGDLGMVFGREGAQVLVNGRVLPSLTVRAGAPQRWRIVNTAKSRYFDLDLRGTRFRQIGGDGGLQEFAVDREGVVLAPGERADVIVVPPVQPGGSIVLRSVIVNRGFGSFEGGTPFRDLVTITAADLPAVSPVRLPDVRQAIQPIPQTGATAVHLEMTLDQPPGGRPEYHLIGPLSPAKHRTLRARVGETQIWTVRNTTVWSHPLHLHGFFFQVLDADGAPVRPLVWKDTVDIPFESTVRLVVRYDDRPGVTGSWMLHCHILDHAEGGLMGMVEVGDAETHPAAGHASDGSH